MQMPNLARIAFHDFVAERDLPISANCDLLVAADADNGCTVECVHLRSGPANPAAIRDSVAPAPRPGMRFVVYMGEMLEIKMCVDLSRRDTRVAQQLLYGSQVSAGLEHMRRE